MDVDSLVKTGPQTALAANGRGQFWHIVRGEARERVKRPVAKPQHTLTKRSFHESRNNTSSSVTW
jgi:hypothetical protein